MNDAWSLAAVVEHHVIRILGMPSGRGSVNFLGAPPIEVLRFGPGHDGVVRYATVGMARVPMGDPSALLVATRGPRAELVLSLRGAHDTVLRRLAALAASPGVDGLVLDAGAAIDLGEPLWEGAPFSAALLGQPGGLLEDLPVHGDAPVRFFPVLPMTANEAAWKRAHGAAALEAAWLAAGTDLRDPQRREVRLVRGTDRA